ncbi:MAG: DedA family protein [Flavobacteriales bacterium]|nr:DedA family protein [Flavobacteriales bacterium]MBL0129053.1 DedA family protein [Flavobacteriales bacterium]MCC6938993.1 DedA family protein [Flavobacteriales bacterium]
MELASAAWQTDLGLWGLFLASFLAATILPFSSEAVLAAFTMGSWPLGTLWLVASLGNWLGGMSSYGVGRLGNLERIAKWLRTDPTRALKWQARTERYGAWAALLCWLPVIGDPIAIAMGLGRTRLIPTALLMFIGKAARYGGVLWFFR